MNDSGGMAWHGTARMAYYIHLMIVCFDFSSLFYAAWILFYMTGFM